MEQRVFPSYSRILYVIVFGVQTNEIVHKERVFTMNHLQKAASLVLAAASVTSCAAIAAYADGFDKGDFNQDGVVDSNDALLTLHASISPELLDYTDFNIIDFNDDGEVNADDALMILRASVYGQESSEPVLMTAAPKKRTQVSEMQGWSAAEVVDAVGPLFTEDQRKTGILASVSMAQFIVESGYGQSKLSLEANNCFGIKGYKEDTPRVDCPWDGVSVYIISTKEYDSYGNAYYTEASFRAYDCMEDSIEDHSRILITSTDGDRPRYEGVVGCKDYRKAAQIIRNGGYATSPDYVDLICDVIEYWDLTQYDLDNVTTDYSYTAPVPAAVEDVPASKSLYRVRLSWDDAASQLGAYAYLENAYECADLNPGYNVYDENGNVLYSS